MHSIVTTYFTSCWSERLPRTLPRLIGSPTTLFVTLMLISAIFRPYVGIQHDARLYALQTVHHLEPERYQDDLFLNYGSQDRYSLFSPIVCPLVKALGADQAFFWLYLGGNACWLFAVQRFVTTLMRGRLVVWGALIYLAVNPLPFGGYATFHVNENFLTPRLWAVALVVLGLESLLRERRVAALGWISIAMLLHPIMGFPGLCVWLCWQLRQILSAESFIRLLVAGAAIIVGVLAYEPLGVAIFGYMDVQWRAYVTDANCYCIPSRWPLADWLHIAGAFTIVATGRLYSARSFTGRRMLETVLLLAGVGLAIGVAAPFFPYKLLFQGQAYRAIWLLQLIHIPILFSLLRHGLKGQLSPTGQIATVAGLSLFAAAMMTVGQFMAAVLAVTAIFSWRECSRQPDRRRARQWRTRAWLACVLSASLVALPFAGMIPNLHAHGISVAQIMLVPQLIGPVATWAAAIAFILFIQHQLGRGSLYRRIALGGCLAVQTCFFLAPGGSPLELLGIDEAADLRLVKSYLSQSDSPRDAAPVLYWPCGPLDAIWLDLQCKSYYSIAQTAGNMFNRDTAVEGYRRMRLVRDFELDVRRPWLPRCQEIIRSDTERLLGKPIESAPPTLDTLLRLCQDEPVDLLVLPTRFDGWYSATNGHVFIYDAHFIRSQLNSASSFTVASSAGVDSTASPSLARAARSDSANHSAP